MTKEASELKMSHDWGKMDLRNHFFLTVRWTDTLYPVGKVMPLVLKGHNIGDVKIVFSIQMKISDLMSDDFTKYDADCDKNVYFEMLKGWYSKKPDWIGFQSNVQLIGVERI